MNLTDIAQQVTSSLDDLDIQKLLMSGLLSSLSFSSNNSWWHARVETFTSLRLAYELETDYKQVYYIVKLHIQSRWPKIGIWNEHDNVTACKVLSKLDCKTMVIDMIRCCETGTVQIMSHLLTNSSLDPTHLQIHIESGEYRYSVWRDALCLAVWNSQPEIVSLLLQDRRVDPSTVVSMHGRGQILQDACRSNSTLLDIEATITHNYSPGDRQAAVVKILLADRRIVPTGQEIYHCRSEILQALLTDPRIDPTQNNNKPLIEAILHRWDDMVTVYLADERVAKLVTEHTVHLVKKYGTAMMIDLVCEQARANEVGRDIQ